MNNDAKLIDKFLIANMDKNVYLGKIETIGGGGIHYESVITRNNNGEPVANVSCSYRHPTDAHDPSIIVRKHPLLSATTRDMYRTINFVTNYWNPAAVLQTKFPCSYRDVCDYGVYKVIIESIIQGHMMGAFLLDRPLPAKWLHRHFVKCSDNNVHPFLIDSHAMNAVNFSINLVYDDPITPNVVKAIIDNMCTGYKHNNSPSIMLTRFLHNVSTKYIEIALSMNYTAIMLFINSINPDLAGNACTEVQLFDSIKMIRQTIINKMRDTTMSAVKNTLKAF